MRSEPEPPIGGLRFRIMGYDIRDLMQLILAEHGNGLHLYVGAAPVLEISRQLFRVEGPTLTSDEPRRMLHDIARPDEIREFENSGLVSFEYEFTPGQFLHVMAFRETGQARLELRTFVDNEEEDSA